MKYNRDITQRDYERCRNKSAVSKGTDTSNELLDHVSHFKGEVKKSENKIVEYNSHIVAHNESGFDSYVILNNIAHWRTAVSLIKNGAGIVSLKIFIGYADKNKKSSV